MNELFNTERFFQVGPIVSEYDRHQAVRAHVLFFVWKPAKSNKLKPHGVQLGKQQHGNRFLTPCGPLAHVLRQPPQPSRLLTKV